PLATRLVIVAPHDLATTLVASQDAACNEEIVGQAIEKRSSGLAHGLATTERHHVSFRTPAGRARRMSRRGGKPATRKNELLERRQLRVELVETLLEPDDVLRADGGVT